LNILYIANEDLPSKAAGSVNVVKMCDALAKNGHSVTLIIPKSKNIHESIDGIYDYYGTNNNFIIKRVSVPISHPYFTNLMLSVYSLYQSRFTNSDIIYGRNLFSCTINALVGSKVIYEIHQPVTDLGKYSKLLFNVLSYCSNQSIVVITKSLKAWYTHRYPRLKNKIVVAPDGAEIISSHLNFININLSKYKIGYFGHLYPGKGMEIISQLVKILPNTRFEIIGGLDKDIEFWRAKLSTNNNIKFHGHIEHYRAIELMQTFNILLAPLQTSISVHSGQGDISRWTSPLKIFEYMASGVPIIASNLPVLREVLSNNYNCIMCDPDDVYSWVNGIKLLKKDKHVGKRLSDQAKQNLQDKYTWSKRAENIIKQSKSII
jgi:glycosyltransferase involved in cell wall biosynthesis